MMMMTVCLDGWKLMTLYHCCICVNLANLYLQDKYEAKICELTLRLYDQEVRRLAICYQCFGLLVGGLGKGVPFFC